MRLFFFHSINQCFFKLFLAKLHLIQSQGPKRKQIHETLQPLLAINGYMYMVYLD